MGSVAFSFLCLFLKDTNNSYLVSSFSLLSSIISSILYLFFCRHIFKIQIFLFLKFDLNSTDLKIEKEKNTI